MAAACPALGLALGRAAAWRYLSVLLFCCIAVPSYVRSQETPNAYRTVAHSQRLSHWLLDQETNVQAQPPADAYVAWYSRDEAVRQAPMREALLAVLGRDADSQRARRLADLATAGEPGRIPVSRPHAAWLLVNPQADPLMSHGDRIRFFTRHKVVKVVGPQGDVCTVRHQAGQMARGYVEACLSSRGHRLQSSWLDDTLNRAWIIQPDGLVQVDQLEFSTTGPHHEPAPGAWLWAPAGDTVLSEKDSAVFAMLLANRGPAIEAGDTPVDPELQKTESGFAERLPEDRNLTVTANDWGVAGLLQTPSARMMPLGTLSVSNTVAQPYQRLNIFLQPLHWLEFGFRYTSITDRLYLTTGDQTYKDKSIDAKFRLLREDTYRPELAVGLIDVAGTGLFSSEYLVASKRWGSVDMSAGLAWGYLGSSGNIAHQTRNASDVGVGGTFQFGTWFSGPLGMFGGLQWKTPIAGLTAKIEYDANDYSDEPSTVAPVVRTPINYGLSYQVASWLDVQAGYERGDQFSVIFNVHAPLNSAPAPKLFDKPPVPVLPAGFGVPPPQPSNWRSTMDALEEATHWRVAGIYQNQSRLVVTFAAVDGELMHDRMDLVARILNRDAPVAVSEFVLNMQPRGLAVNTVRVDRVAFVRDLTELRSDLDRAARPAFTELEQEASSPQRDMSLSASDAPATDSTATLDHGFELGYAQSLGGPDAFWLYQLSAQYFAELRLREDTWLNGVAKHAFAGNYGLWKAVGPFTNLQPVRTMSAWYSNSLATTIPVAQATHTGQLNSVGPNQYYAVYGGMLEPMFGGVGAEYLWRPWHKPLALGLDWNVVRQRSYTETLGLLDYSAQTGHASVYWDTGWNGVRAVLKAGQYLAGDRGASVYLTREFASGAKMGVYATKTNISAAEFGEGSFDKGIFLSIPFDLMLPMRSTINSSFMWQPIVRDGGAMLSRRFPLYDLTSKSDSSSMGRGRVPAP